MLIAFGKKNSTIIITKKEFFLSCTSLCFIDLTHHITTKYQIQTILLIQTIMVTKCWNHSRHIIRQRWSTKGWLGNCHKPCSEGCLLYVNHVVTIVHKQRTKIKRCIIQRTICPFFETRTVKFPSGFKLQFWWRLIMVDLGPTWVQIFRESFFYVATICSWPLQKLLKLGGCHWLW